MNHHGAERHELTEYEEAVLRLQTAIGRVTDLASGVLAITELNNACSTDYIITYIDMIRDSQVVLLLLQSLTLSSDANSPDANAVERVRIIIRLFNTLITLTDNTDLFIECGAAEKLIAFLPGIEHVSAAADILKMVVMLVRQSPCTCDFYCARTRAAAYVQCLHT